MSGLFGFSMANLRGDWRRSAAAGAAILTAVASFVVLTGTVSTQQLQVTQQVESNYRSTYDILVRPQGSASEAEQVDGVVRPNFLAASYGGITLAQVDQIAAVPGVDVAAPVAVLGQTMRSVLLAVNVRDLLRNREHVLLRFGLVGAARNHTARTSNQAGFLYLTRNRLTSVDDATSEGNVTTPGQVEHRAGGKITACLASNVGGVPDSPQVAFGEYCWSSDSDEQSGDPRVEALLSLPLTVEAVDPDAEARLTGLDRAIVDGRSLSEKDSFSTDNTGPAPIDGATAIMSSSMPLDFEATLTVDELSESTTGHVLATKDANERRRIVLEATPLRRIKQVVRDAADAYRKDISANVDPGSGRADQSLIVNSLTQPGDVTFTGTNPMTPAVVAFDPDVWKSSPESDTFLPAPSSVSDTSYRHVTGQPKTGDGFVSFQIVGKYDPDRLPRPSQLNDVPLETYRPSSLEGANAASRLALGDKPMLSDLNPAGYVQSPPALLVPIKSLPLFWKNFNGLNLAAPVSSVRVRVANITGLDPVARERIRQIADQIHTQTGLDVDITIGASLQNRQVDLPPTSSGTPGLLLNERWTKKGVAVAITDALDVKSLVLFLIILASSALTIALIATATVQARRRQLATLACLGWRRGWRSAAIGVELSILGLAAGALGGLISVPIAQLLGITVPWWQTILAVPLGILLALIPGLAATAAAGRIAPVEAFRPRQQHHRLDGMLALRGPITLGLIMAGRRPGRALLASLAVALAVASAVVLTGIVTAFNGAVVGSFLGDAVALQVRTPDIAAAIILAALGLTAITTVLLLALFEDAPSYAALQAAGWSDASLATTLVSQAVAISILGAALGVGTSVAIITLFIAPIDATILWAAAGIGSSAVILSFLATLVPATLARGLPIAHILARE